MRKILVLAICAAALALPLAAQQAAGTDEETGLTYINVVVHKVYDHRDAYIVVYAKSSNRTATVVIPKTWVIQQPRKLQFRKLRSPITQSFMTVFYRGTQFERVFLTMPQDRRRSVWGTAPYADIQGELGKEALLIERD